MNFRQPKQWAFTRKAVKENAGSVPSARNLIVGRRASGVNAKQVIAHNIVDVLKLTELT